MGRLVALAVLAALPTHAQDCAWVQAHPNNVPTDPIAQVMAFDNSRGVSVLFSSKGPGSAAETLEWDGTDWILRDDNGPSQRGATAMAFDSQRGVCVLYGGRSAAGDLFDTWEWDGNVWTKQPGGTVPSSGHAMAYDSDRGVTVLFGGVFQDEQEETYWKFTREWNGTDWREAADSGPSPRVSHVMAYDPERKVTVLYGGAGPAMNYSDTWEWNGQVWTERKVVGPGKRNLAAMVYDADLHACVLFGGGGNQISDDSWAWDGVSWVQLDLPNPPPPRYGHAMAFDSARHAAVVFGGRLEQDFFDDTWEFTRTPPPCYPDLDGNGTLDLFDFLSFVNAFNAGDTGPADCDHNHSLNLFDFLCYTNAFNQGC